MHTLLGACLELAMHLVKEDGTLAQSLQPPCNSCAGLLPPAVQVLQFLRDARSKARKQRLGTIRLPAANAVPRAIEPATEAIRKWGWDSVAGGLFID